MCLSVLNTWSGQKSEKWGPHATFLQVLISLQALVFVKEPYYNEPGYESSMGSAQGIKRSEGYNKRIRNATMRWAILDMLQNPPQEFKHVIESHFYLHRDRVAKQCDAWAAKSAITGALGGSLEHTSTIKTLLSKLEPPA